jgi:CubicO group peptidase (beta-lactamase class C family)
MNIKRYLIPIVLLGGMVALTLRLLARLFSSHAAIKPAFKNSNSDAGASYTAIDAYVEEQMRRLHIPGAALVIVEGEQIVHLRGFGRSRPGGETPTAQTPFFIGSLTKSITALAIMQLVEAGKVELDAPVQRYLPWFRVADPQASEQMTVRHMLNQTSGMPTSLGLAGLGDFADQANATERQVRTLATLKLDRPVGARFEYSNSNYNVLGMIVEAASGEAYADYIQRHIFNPLEMHHSYASKAAAQQDSLAVGHRYWFGQPIPIPNLSIPPGSLPSGQLICSAEDMGHYLIAQLNGGKYSSRQILSEAGIDAMQRGAAEIKEMGMALGSYGMGWIDQEVGKTRIVSHSGIVPDFGAFMALVPEQKKGFALLFNANHAMMKLTFDEMGMGAAQRLAGEAPAPQKFGAAPWAMRGLALIPILQIIGVAGTLVLLVRWRENPELRPSCGRLWRQHILLPLIPNLLTALTLAPLLGKLRGFMRLFAPDFTWIALICGSFAVVWSILRSALILRVNRKSA